MNLQFEKDFQSKCPTPLLYMSLALTQLFDSLAYALGKKALYKDDLNQMRGFNIAIDASLLLSLVTRSNALQSLQDGHSNLDILVQRKVQEVLSMFWSRFAI